MPFCSSLAFLKMWSISYLMPPTEPYDNHKPNKLPRGTRLWDECSASCPTCLTNLDFIMATALTFVAPAAHVRVPASEFNSRLASCACDLLDSLACLKPVQSHLFDLGNFKDLSDSFIRAISENLRLPDKVDVCILARIASFLVTVMASRDENRFQL